MNVNRVINVEDGDTVNALREFLASWWTQNKFDAILAPVERSDNSGIEMRLIEDPQGLVSVNPFAPVMVRNAARMTIEFIHDHPTIKLVAMFRPCELRTFFELRKCGYKIANSGELVLLGVDCPGLIQEKELSRQIVTSSIGLLTRASLRDAAEGNKQWRFLRTACKICDWPAPRGADVSIGVIGVDNENLILIIVSDETVDARLVLNSTATEFATEYQVSHRETVVGAVADRCNDMRRILLEEFQSSCRYNDLGCLLALFTNCNLCGNCLNACPLYLGGGAQFQDKFSFIEELVHLGRWLASCSGCGLCEQMCDQGIPLTLLVSSLSHRICQELNYVPGDPFRQLPWAS